MKGNVMFQRSHGRTATQIRPIKITPNYLKYPLGSALCEYGDTKVICSATLEDYVPGWLRGTRGRGWLTAEFSMLPFSTLDRSKRERQFLSGRTHEIQRLIGRSLRGIMDLNLLGERTMIIDCDVLQADGGTRTASVTGAFVALKLAVDELLRKKKIQANPIKDSVAGVSLGLLDEEILVDLDFEEDQKVDSDLNIVMTSSGEILEVQGTVEKKAIDKSLLGPALDYAQAALEDIFAEQGKALD